VTPKTPPENPKADEQLQTAKWMDIKLIQTNQEASYAQRINRLREKLGK
jgi:hypothetical protein